jgi:hypothetical protein
MQKMLNNLIDFSEENNGFETSQHRRIYSIQFYLSQSVKMGRNRRVHLDELEPNPKTLALAVKRQQFRGGTPVSVPRCICCLYPHVFNRNLRFKFHLHHLNPFPEKTFYFGLSALRFDTIDHD